MPASIQDDLDVVELIPPTGRECLPQECDLATSGYLANEDDAAFGNGQSVGVEIEFGWQSAQALSPSILRRRALSQTRLNMLFVDRGHPSSEFASQDGGVLEVSLEEQRLEPAVEVFHGAIALGTALGNEDGRHAQVETQSNYARQIVCRFAPTAELASIVELHLGR